MKVIYTELNKEVIYNKDYPLEKIMKDILYKIPYNPKIKIIEDTIYVSKTILTQ